MTKSKGAAKIVDEYFAGVAEPARGMLMAVLERYLERGKSLVSPHRSGVRVLGGARQRDGHGTPPGVPATDADACVSPSKDHFEPRTGWSSGRGP